MKVAKGKLVSISYQIRDDNDQVLEHNDVPIDYLHGGQHDVFPEVEAALEGKSIDDEVIVKIPAVDAFGPHDPSLTFTDDIENSPPEVRFIGAEMDLENASREVLHFRVTQIEDGKITIDANHVFAGIDLTFLVTVKGVKNPLEQ